MPQDAMRLMGQSTSTDLDMFERDLAAELSQSDCRPGWWLLEQILEIVPRRLSEIFGSVVDLPQQPQVDISTPAGRILMLQWLHLLAGANARLAEKPRYMDRGALIDTACACLWDAAAMQRLSSHHSTVSSAQAADWGCYSVLASWIDPHRLFSSWAHPQTTVIELFLGQNPLWGEARAWKEYLLAGLSTEGGEVEPSVSGSVQDGQADWEAYDPDMDPGDDGYGEPARPDGGYSAANLEAVLGDLKPSREVPDQAAGEDDREQDMPVQPCLQVLDSVGDHQSADGVNASRRFATLLRPMPLRGADTTADEIYSQLRAEFPWMEEANVRLAQSVRLCGLGQGWFRFPPLLLAGPPGVGKTRWARRAADLLGVSYGFLSLSGMSSSMGISGSERGWSGARPSFIALTLAQAQSANPLVVLDEIDKAGEGKHNGNSLDALMPMLAEETKGCFPDTFLLGKLDLRAVSWVATANAIDSLPAPLTSRFDLIWVRRPTVHEALRAIPGMIGEIAAAYGIPATHLPELANAYSQFEQQYASMGSLRALYKAVEATIREQAWQPPGPRAVIL